MRPKGSDWFRRPEIILSDLLRTAARGEIATRDHHFMRATVLAVDPEGGKLENPKAEGSYSALGTEGRNITLRATHGPANPVGSIKARILTDGLDRIRSDQEVRTFWPLFPQDQMAVPISPGEHVYVMFEGNEKEHGLWVSRVAGHESAGSFQGTESYTSIGRPTNAMDSFEPSSPEYPRDDGYASMAPSRGAMGVYEEED